MVESVYMNRVRNRRRLFNDMRGQHRHAGHRVKGLQKQLA